MHPSSIIVESDAFFYLYNRVNIIINNSNITTKVCFFVISITTLLIIIEGKASDIQMYPN
jgi:hypothetical protein